MSYVHSTVLNLYGFHRPCLRGCEAHVWHTQNTWVQWLVSKRSFKVVFVRTAKHENFPPHTTFYWYPDVILEIENIHMFHLLQQINWASISNYAIVHTHFRSNRLHKHLATVRVYTSLYGLEPWRAKKELDVLLRGSSRLYLETPPENYWWV